MLTATAQPTNKSAEEKLQPANPEFEQSLKGDALDLAEKKDGRGGYRPNAGRPPGMTDELSRINKLPDVANELIVDVLEIPFEFWAEMTKTPELELTKEEAHRLGLPVTQLMEYFFPGKIPLIAWAFLNLAVTAKKIMLKRFKILSGKRKGAQGAPGGQPGQSSPTRPAAAAGSKDTVPPAKGYARTNEEH